MKSVIYFDDSSVYFNDKKIIESSLTFRPDVYSASTDRRTGKLNIFVKELAEVLPPIHSEESALVLDTIRKFYDADNKRKINDCGFLHKLGILLYGKQGTGKTSLYKYIVQQAVQEHQAIAFIAFGINSLEASVDLIQTIRRHQDNPIILLIDELESYTHNHEQMIKEILDGSYSVDNFLILSSTNYISEIPEAVKHRPSRFKLTLEMNGISNPQQMIAIASHILKDHTTVADDELSNLFADQQELTLDEIKHIVQDLIMGTNFTIEKRKIGFHQHPTKRKYKRPIPEEEFKKLVLASNM